MCLFLYLDTPSLAAQLLECQTDKKSDESKKDTSQVGLELVEYISAANSGKWQVTCKTHIHIYVM